MVLSCCQRRWWDVFLSTAGEREEGTWRRWVSASQAGKRSRRGLTLAAGVVPVALGKSIANGLQGHLSQLMQILLVQKFRRSVLRVGVQLQISR